MKAETPVSRARELFAAGKLHEAHRALCQAAVENGPQVEAQTALKEMFPIPPPARDWIDGTLPMLFEDDKDLRSKAAKALTKVAVAEYGYRQWDRIGHPEAMDIIIKALASDDSKVVEAAIIATARVSQYYFRDPDALQPALKLLRSTKTNIRRWAVQAVTYLNQLQAAGAILPLLSDRSVEVQIEVARMISSLAQSRHLTESAKSEAIELMLGPFASYASSVRDTILSALRDINDPSVIESLRNAARTEPEEALKRRIAEVIKGLQEPRAIAN